MEKVEIILSPIGLATVGYLTAKSNPKSRNMHTFSCALDCNHCASLPTKGLHIGSLILKMPVLGDDVDL